MRPGPGSLGISQWTLLESPPLHSGLPSAGTLWISEGVSKVCLLEVSFLSRLRATASSLCRAGIRGDGGCVLSLQVAVAVLQRMLACESSALPRPKLA